VKNPTIISAIAGLDSKGFCEELWEPACFTNMQDVGRIPVSFRVGGANPNGSREYFVTTRVIIVDRPQSMMAGPNADQQQWN